MGNDLQELFCQAGNHTWTRAAKRGRKPPSCPEHTVPVKPERAAINVKILTCAAGHSWEHRGRGNPPKWCPEHRPVPVNVREVVCAFDGHTWIRAHSKGKAPKFCPEHKPSKVEETKGPVPVRGVDISDPTAVAILSGPVTERQRQVKYIIRQFENWEDSDRIEVDWDSLRSSYKRLLEDEKKSLRTSTYVQT